MAQTLSLDLLLFYAHGQIRCLDPQPVALMGEVGSLVYFSRRVFQEMKVFQ